jgi:hypothetical protein
MYLKCTFATILWFTQRGDESGVRDNGTGEIVARAEEGGKFGKTRLSRPGHVGTRDLEVEFLDVQSDSDRPNVKEALLTAVARIRARHEDQIEALLTTVDQLIANRANEEAEAVFEAAVRPLRGWKYQFCSD